MDQGIQKQVSSNRVVLVSFLVDILDVILSFAAVMLSGSIVMLSQVMEGASDLLASGLLYIGLIHSQKKPDTTHPFGYGRELYFWVLISSLITFASASTLSIYFGIDRILNPKPIENSNFALSVLVLTTLTNGYALSLSVRRLLRKHSLKNIFRIFINSSLIEAKTTLVLDSMGTIASILGVIALLTFDLTKDLRYDGFGSLAIGISLAILSYVLIISVKELLIGKKASQEIESKIREHSLSVPNVKQVLGIKTMHIGSEKLLVNLDVELENKLTTKEIEKLIDEIKLKIRNEIPAVKHIQVELETPEIKTKIPS